MAAGSGVAAAKGTRGTLGLEPVSFMFSHRAERWLLPVGSCMEPGMDSGTNPNTDSWTAVEDQELLSTRLAPPPPKELVIPLVTTHSWRNLECPHTDTCPAPAAGDTPSTDPTPTGAPLGPSSLEAQAGQELLQEAQQSQEQPKGGLGPPMTIPLQLPNKDVPTGPLLIPQDYEAMPVGQFGLAMLRGMGWSQGQGIRHTFPAWGRQPDEMAALGKQYGLIMPKMLPQKNLVSKKLSVFADESDEEPTVGESLQKEALKKQAMKQTKLEIQKALEEDATVYEYDSIYDEMQQKKKESSTKMLAGNNDKKPRYIHNILKVAKIRKKEQERRMERKIQKERELEGAEFAHKEAFVTSAYKKKLQERAEEKEREKRESALEAYLDVTKQRDFSGFYRHLLNQHVGEEKMHKCSFREARIKEEKPDSQDKPDERNKCPSERQRVKASKKENNPDADTDLGTDSSDDDKRHKQSKVNLKKKKRRESSVSSEEEAKHHKSQRHCMSPSSSSVEEEPCTKAQISHQRGERRPSRRGNDEQYREKDYERSRTHGKDHQREREEQHRPRDHANRDHYRRREDQDDKQRGKERKEKEGHGSEWRTAKEREEKSTEKEREKERTRKDKDRYNDREKERGEKHREREDHAKERREKYGSDKKKYKERRESTLTPLEKDGETDLGKERKGKNREVDEKGSSSSGKSEQTRKAREEGEKEEKEQAQKASETLSKFAKRSNEETVMSARDRYLTRHMNRDSTKPYIEEED